MAGDNKARRGGSDGNAADRLSSAVLGDYPARSLNRLTSALRIFVAIPILIVLGP
jgi:hypothetical protein